MLIASKDLVVINDLKHQLNTNFEMKDLGAAKRILGMQIQRDRKQGTLFLCQSDYLAKVLERFEMLNAKPVSIPVASHFKVSKDQEPQHEQERDMMKNVSYSNDVGVFNVYHGVYKARYNTWSKPGKQAYDKSRKESLSSSQVAVEVH
ncbi:unnamed protein product [Rhodiola kirilowii]